MPALCWPSAPAVARGVQSEAGESPLSTRHHATTHPYCLGQLVVHSLAVRTCHQLLGLKS